MNEVLLTAEQWASMLRAPLRDQSYQLTGLGPAVADFLAWKKLDGAAERTLDQYERDISRACVLYPEKSVETLTSEDILHVITVFPPRSQKRAQIGARLDVQMGRSLGAGRSQPDGSRPTHHAAPRSLRRSVHGGGGFRADERSRSA